MSNLFLNLPVPALNGVGAAVDTSAMGATKTIVVGGPFQGTVTIEYANDDAAAVWAPVPNGSFVSNPGRVTIDLAVKWMRAVMSAFKGGLANADVGASNVPGAGFFVPLGPGALDISNMPPFKTVVASGACNVEISEDGISWSQAFSFQNKGGQSGTVVAKFARVIGAGAWLGATDLVDDDNEILPPFALTITFIFANVDGSDETGTGTEDNPYRTFQRAVRDVPAFIPPSVRYVIDITNLGDEELPANYGLPAWSGSRGIHFAEEGPSGFNVSIVADHEPAIALTPAERTVTITSTSANQITKTIVVTDTSQNWAPGSLKGLFVSFEDEDLSSVIYDNTNDTLFLTGNDSSPVVLPIGSVMTITEPSARLITTNTEFGFTGGFRINDASSIYMFGISIKPASVPDNFGGLYASNSTLWIDNSVLVQARFDSAPRQYYCVGCYVTEAVLESRMYLARGLLQDAGEDGVSFSRPAQTGLLIHSGQVLDNVSVFISDGLTDLSLAVGGFPLVILGVLIRNSPSDAVQLVGGVSWISGLEVDSAQGNALSFSGPGKHILKSVVGTGSTGVGIRVDDGAQVEAQTIEGTGDSLAFVIDPDEGPLVTLTNVGAGFDKFPTPQTITIAGAVPAGNNGTFEIVEVIDADNISYRNPDGANQAVFAGTWVIDPVTVTGANDQQVGDLAAGAYPAIPFNIVDVYGGANPNITGTGARFFNK